MPEARNRSGNHVAATGPEPVCWTGESDSVAGFGCTE
jgi:hypothetical protein